MRAKYFLLAIFSFLAGLSNQLFAQEISALTPASAVPGPVIDVAIRGVNSHFRSGVSVASFGDGITILNLSVENTITATATIRISSSAAPGFRNVRITTGSEVAELTGGFEVFDPSGAFRANIQLLPLESVSLKDIDLSQPSHTPILFFTNLYNDNTARTVNINVLVSSSSKGLLGTMMLKNVSLAANAVTKYTNRDFTAVKINGITGKDFLAYVETTGTFPPDDYLYKLIVTDVNGTVLATDESPLAVSNPLTNPELILPGASFGTNVTDVYTPFPLFQWFGMCNKYDFAMYEYREGQTQEDVVRNITVYQQKDISATNLLYPAFAEKLVDGKIYAWQILGKVKTATGTKYLPSEVFRFRYTDITNTGKKVVSRITITPEEAVLAPGAQQQFTAIFYDDNGALIMDAAPAWSVSPNYGSITQTGLFTAGPDGGKTAAVLVKAGTGIEFATVTINAINISSGQSPFDGFIKKLFGLQ
jgi:hypothetical protein